MNQPSETERSPHWQTTRSRLVEIAGTVVSMILGAIAGMLVPGKAEAAVTNVVVCALVAWVIWMRRRKPFATTLQLVLVLLIILWPITFAFLGWLHRYY